jgi:hypothetical protein
MAFLPMVDRQAASMIVFRSCIDCFCCVTTKVSQFYDLLNPNLQVVTLLGEY